MIVIDENSDLSRRDFAFNLTALAGLFFTGESIAQDEKKPKEANSNLEAIETMVRNRLGKILNDEQIKQVARSVQSRLRSGELLRKQAVENGDDPANAFRADLP